MAYGKSNETLHTQLYPNYALIFFGFFPTFFYCFIAFFRFERENQMNHLKKNKYLEHFGYVHVIFQSIFQITARDEIEWKGANLV